MRTTGTGWVGAFANTTLAFAPRGVGATSYRLYEAIQLGVPAVFAFGDRPWLPYLHPSHIGATGRRALPPARFFSPHADALPPAPAEPFPWDAVAHSVEILALDAWARDTLPALVPTAVASAGAPLVLPPLSIAAEAHEWVFELSRFERRALLFLLPPGPS
jgi:hypothetical protein